MASEKTKTQVRELTDMLANGVRDLYQSDKYQAYLDSMASLMQFSPSRYSARNYALIYMQNPNATLVAGFNAWKQLDRHVTGEAKGKGIKILAPTPYVIKTEEQKIDEETEIPLFDSEGKPIMEKVEKIVPDWKYVTVFDIRETDGKPLPHLAEDLAGNVLHYDAFMDALREISPLPMVFEKLSPEVDGTAYYGDRIALREGMSQRQTVSAAIHELAHTVLHDTTRGAVKSEAEAPPMTKSAKEIQAESISCIICKRFGIDTGANSFGYLASYEKEADTAGLLKSLKIIQETAADLIDKIDTRFHEICAERGIDISPIEAVHAPPEREAAEQFAGEYYEFLSGVTDKAGKNPFSLDSREQSISDIAEEIVTGNHQDITAMLHNASDYGIDPSRLLKKFDRLINSTPWVFPDDPTAVNEIDGLQTEPNQPTAPAMPEKQYDLGYGHMGNGLTVWNRLEEKNGDYVTVAHIDPDRNVTFYDKDMPDSVKARIEDVARTSNMTISATQDTPVFSTPAQTPDLDLPAPGPDPSVILPDPAINLFERNLYGYTYDAMLPLTQARAVELYDQDHAVYLLYPDDTEGAAFDREEIENHDGIFGIEREEWEASQEYQEMAGATANSEAAKEAALIYGNENAFGLYQLKGGEETRDYRFEALASIVTQSLSVDRANYELVYTAPLTENDTLDNIYEKFNIDHPADFTGHSLSVSDVVVLRQDGNLSSHYVDSLGFKGLPAFLGNEKQAQVAPPVQSEPMKNSYVDLLKEHINNHYDAGYLTAADRDILSAHMEAMNTYMMDFANKYETGVPLDVETDTIDRIFQDTLAKSQEQTQPVPPAPTVAELEAEVKAGNQISVTDLARAVKNEPKQPPAKKEKPSILAQLKEMKQAAQTKDQHSPAPKRGNDLEV